MTAHQRPRENESALGVEGPWLLHELSSRIPHSLPVVPASAATRAASFKWLYRLSRRLMRPPVIMVLWMMRFGHLWQKHERTVYSSRGMILLTHGRSRRRALPNFFGYTSTHYCFPKSSRKQQSCWTALSMNLGSA